MSLMWYFMSIRGYMSGLVADEVGRPMDEVAING